MTLPLGVGLDTKTDAKLLPVGRNALVENARFDKTGSLIKRFGKTQLANSVLNNEGTISDAVDVFEFDSELCLVTSDSIYSRYGVSTPWVKKGSVTPANLITNRVFQASRNQAIPTSAYSDDYICVSWYETDSGGSARVMAGVLSRETMEPVVAATVIASGVSSAKIECHRIGDNFVVFYSTNAGTPSVYTTYISAVSPTVFSSPTTLNASSNGAFTISAHDSSVVVIAINKATTTFTLGYVKSDGTFAGSGDGYSDAADVTVSYTGTFTNMHVHSKTTSTAAIFLFITEFDSGSSVYTVSCEIFDQSFSSAVSLFSVDSDLGNLGAIKTSAVNDGSSGVILYYDSYSGQNIIKRVSVSNAGSVGSPENYIYNLFLVGKPVSIGSKTFVCCRSQSDAQLGFFVFDSDRNTIARISLGNSSDSLLTRIDASMLDVGSDLFVTSLYARDVTGPGFFFDSISDTAGVQITRIDFSGDGCFSKEKFGDGLILSGAVPRFYDGASLTELGFNHFPTLLTNSITTMDGTSITAGTRQYTYIYEWVDNHGQIHRSAPCKPISVTNENGDSNTLTFYSINATSKDGVRIGLFRTKDGGTTFYRVDIPESLPILVSSSQTVTFKDVSSDSVIESNETLYTNGGVLENIAPPACRSVSVYQNRAVLSGCEDGGEYWYSKSYIKGEGPGFNEVFTNRADSGRGGVNASSVLDEKLVFLKPDDAFFDQGQGPTDTGSQNDFSIPQKIPGDAGTIYSKSVVQTPHGVVFKSSKGIMLLNRAIQVEHVGDPVSEWNALSISGAHLLSNKNQVVFVHSDGYALVYDHLEKKWNVWDNYESVGVTQWNGMLVSAKSDGSVFFEDPSTYLDSSSDHVPMRIITPWVKLESLEGFQRMYEAILLAEIRGRCIVKFSVGYDYNPNWSETREFDTSSVWGNRSQTDGAYYTPNGSKFTGTSGEESAVEIRFKPARQKCSSVRLMIETDQKTSGDDYADLVITGLDFILGMKQTLNKIPSRKAAS